MAAQAPTTNRCLVTATRRQAQFFLHATGGVPPLKTHHSGAGVRSLHQPSYATLRARARHVDRMLLLPPPPPPPLRKLFCVRTLPRASGTVASGGETAGAQCGLPRGVP